MVIEFHPMAGETIYGMDTGRSMECAKKCHTVESVGISFYNTVKGAALECQDICVTLH